MGHGPLYLCEHREGRGTVTIIDVPAPFPTEVGTSFAVYRSLAKRVATAVRRGEHPLVLAGNCGSALGTVSGIQAGTPNDSRVGVIWLDAHADFNTPDTTTTGFLDGTVLAALTGRGWNAMTAAIPGFRPVPDEDVILVGARDIDPAEERLLAASGVTRVEASRIRADGVAAALDAALTALARHVSRVYLHIDLDVHDPSAAQANQYPVPNGLTPNDVRELVGVVAQRFEIAATALTAYDPSYDDRMLTVGLELIDVIAHST